MTSLESWEARLNQDRILRSGNPAAGSHYPEGYIPEAVSVLLREASNIEQAVLMYCSDMDTAKPLRISADVGAYYWRKHLATRLYPGFIADHQETLPHFPDLVTQEYQAEFAALFSDLHVLLSHEDTSIRLNNISEQLCLRPESFTRGWTAILRENGLFSFVARHAYLVMTEIYQTPSNDLTGHNLRVYFEGFARNRAIDFRAHFSIPSHYTIGCPAKGSVLHHLLPCIGFNAALVRQRLLTPERYVPLASTADTWLSLDTMHSIYRAYTE